MADTLQAFVAIQMPEEIADVVWQVQDILQQNPSMEPLRWVDPDDAHITLKFLGETPIPRLPAIVDALDGVAATLQPFSARLGQLGAFPNVERPNNVWLDLAEGETAVQHLYNAVEVALKRLGFKPERSRYYPHVALARVPNFFSDAQRRAVGEQIGAIELPEFPAFTVNAIALIRSELSSEGPVHTRLANSVFGAPAPLQDDDWEDIP